MVFSARVALPLFDVRGELSKVELSRAACKLKVACEKSNRKSRKLSRKRRRFRRNFERRRKNKETKNMSPVTTASGPFDSYWQNYNRCLKWTQNHHMSYWKSRVQALEYENTMLRSMVEQNFGTENTIPSSSHNTYCPKYKASSGESDNWSNYKYGYDTSSVKNKVNHVGVNCSEDIDNRYKDANEVELDSCDKEANEFEFEVDHNMIEFFTQSMIHKLALKQQRSETENSQEIERKDHNVKKCGKWSHDKSQEKHFSREGRSRGEQFPGKKRISFSHNSQEHHVEGTELEILLKKADQEEREVQKVDLFGNGAPKITGMETAMQLTFQQTCASNHPTTWPVIPLNLKF